jgi:tRNA pseudouridine32 synthase/23S rRNA pseudouridine746 synthase
MDTKCHSFVANISRITPPDIVDFPFYYEPHELAKHAAYQVQEHLTNTSIEHNFGLNKDDKGVVIGKMFGVLVVMDAHQNLGFIAAFSGKLANSNHHDYFVPPVFDLLEQNGFYVNEEREIVGLTNKIDALKNAASYLKFKREFKLWENEQQEILQSQKERIKLNKSCRDKQRMQIAEQEPNAKTPESLSELDLESKMEQIHMKQLKRAIANQRTIWEVQLATFESEIERLEEERSLRSSQLQQLIFKQYTFLNEMGREQSLLEIFQNHPLQQPPAGAGECSAPKLFQYAFKNNYRPIALAEFWWGKSPASEIRVHKHFYPACRGKCEPILNHMLSETIVAPNPMLKATASESEIDIIYKDDAILVINKPAELLSVPGKYVTDSVYTRIKSLFPTAEGPLIVHRLDMSTSGIMILALSKKAHAHLQRQFLKRSIKKSYLAMLNGHVSEDYGTIQLPLRVDLDDRPRQLVCYIHGKMATTKWEVLQRHNDKTKVQFFPITGRTHQLRVHSAHPKGLNTPILGDDLYGQKSDRLYLHAWKISIKHPSTNKNMDFTTEDPFRTE